MTDLGQKIKELRMDKGLTLEEFGNRFDPPASKGTVHTWENNLYKPNAKRLKHIAKLAGKTVSEFMCGPLPAKRTMTPERIKGIRSKLNMTQKQLADEIGASVPAVSNWECGRNGPNSIMIYRLDKLAGGYYLSPNTIQRLFEYLEIQEEMFYAHEYSVRSLYSGWLGGQVHILEKIREWEDDENY